MVRIDVANYIGQLRSAPEAEKEADLYSIKKELSLLDGSTAVFDDFENESIKKGKYSLEQIGDLSLLLKIKSIASEIRKKKKINEKMHSLHFSLNLG